MKTKLCRPVLVKTNTKSQLLINKINGRLLFDCESIIIENAQYQELILISLYPKEKIEIGDKYYNSVRKKIHICENEIEKQSVNQFKEYAHKVIATQSQIPPKYIQQFIEEYNINSVKDIEIEMEEYDHDEEWSEISGAYETCRYRPKLINGFISIVDNKDDSDKEIIDYVFNKPILYTEEEIEELVESYLFDLSSTYKEIPFRSWFEQNKKK